VFVASNRGQGEIPCPKGIQRKENHTWGQLGAADRTVSARARRLSSEFEHRCNMLHQQRSVCFQESVLTG